MVLLPFLPLEGLVEPRLGRLPLSTSERARATNDDAAVLFAAADAPLACHAPVADEGGADEGGADEGGVDEGGADEGSVDEGSIDEGGADEGGVDEGRPHRRWRTVAWELGRLAGRVAPLGAREWTRCVAGVAELADTAATDTAATDTAATGTAATDTAVANVGATDVSPSPTPRRVWVGWYKGAHPTPRHRSVLLHASAPLETSLTLGDLAAAGGGRVGRHALMLHAAASGSDHAASDHAAAAGFARPKGAKRKRGGASGRGASGRGAAHAAPCRPPSAAPPAASTNEGGSGMQLFGFTLAP